MKIDNDFKKTSTHKRVDVKKPFYKRWWFIGGAVVLVVIGAMPSNKSSDNQSSDVKTVISSKKNQTDETKDNTAKNSDAMEKIFKKSKNETKAEKKSKQLETVSVGQPIRVGDVEYTVNSQNTNANVGNEYLNKTANGIYLIVNVTVKNLGDDALTVTNNFFKLIKDDKEYESDSTAGIYANNDSKFFLDKVNPEGSVTGNIVFDVTKETVDAGNLKLQVQTGAWGTQKGLINLN